MRLSVFRHSMVNLISYTLVVLLMIFFLSESVEAAQVNTELENVPNIVTVRQDVNNAREKVSQQVDETELPEDLKQAIEKLDQDVKTIATIPKASKDELDVANSIYQTATEYEEIGLLTPAISHYKFAYIFYNSSNSTPKSRAGKIACLDKIAILNIVLGNREEAIYYYNEILNLAQSTGDKKSESTVFIKIGIAHAHFEEIQQALVAFNQALSISNSISDDEGQAYAFYNLGTTNLKLGEKQKALSYFNQALPIFQTIGNLERTNATLEYIQSIS